MADNHAATPFESSLSGSASSVEFATCSNSLRSAASLGKVQQLKEWFEQVHNAHAPSNSSVVSARSQSRCRLLDRAATEGQGFEISGSVGSPVALAVRDFQLSELKIAAPVRPLRKSTSTTPTSERFARKHRRYVQSLFEEAALALYDLERLDQTSVWAAPQRLHELEAPEAKTDSGRAAEDDFQSTLTLWSSRSAPQSEGWDAVLEARRGAFSRAQSESGAVPGSVHERSTVVANQQAQQLIDESCTSSMEKLNSNVSTLEHGYRDDCLSVDCCSPSTPKSLASSIRSSLGYASTEGVLLHDSVADSKQNHCLIDPQPAGAPSAEGPAGITSERCSTDAGLFWNVFERQSDGVALTDCTHESQIAPMHDVWTSVVGEEDRHWLTTGVADHVDALSVVAPTLSPLSEPNIQTQTFSAPTCFEDTDQAAAVGLASDSQQAKVPYAVLHTDWTALPTGAVLQDIAADASETDVPIMDGSVLEALHAGAAFDCADGDRAEPVCWDYKSVDEQEIHGQQERTLEAAREAVPACGDSVEARLLFGTTVKAAPALREAHCMTPGSNLNCNTSDAGDDAPIPVDSAAVPATSSSAVPDDAHEEGYHSSDGHAFDLSYCQTSPEGSVFDSHHPEGSSNAAQTAHPESDLAADTSCFHDASPELFPEASTAAHDGPEQMLTADMDQPMAAETDLLEIAHDGCTGSIAQALEPSTAGTELGALPMVVATAPAAPTHGSAELDSEDGTAGKSDSGAILFRYNLDTECDAPEVCEPPVSSPEDSEQRGVLPKGSESQEPAAEGSDLECSEACATEAAQLQSMGDSATEENNVVGRDAACSPFNSMGQPSVTEAHQLCARLAQARKLPQISIGTNREAADLLDWSTTPSSPATTPSTPPSPASTPSSIATNLSSTAARPWRNLSITHTHFANLSASNTSEESELPQIVIASAEPSGCNASLRAPNPGTDASAQEPARRCVACPVADAHPANGAVENDEAGHPQETSRLANQRHSSTRSTVPAVSSPSATEMQSPMWETHSAAPETRFEAPRTNEGCTTYNTAARGPLQLQILGRITNSSTPRPPPRFGAAASSDFHIIPVGDAPSCVPTTTGSVASPSSPQPSQGRPATIFDPVPITSLPEHSLVTMNVCITATSLDHVFDFEEDQTPLPLYEHIPEVAKQAGAGEGTARVPLETAVAACLRNGSLTGGNITTQQLYHQLQLGSSVDRDMDRGRKSARKRWFRRSRVWLVHAFANAIRRKAPSASSVTEEPSRRKERWFRRRRVSVGCFPTRRPPLDEVSVRDPSEASGSMDSDT